METRQVPHHHLVALGQLQESFHTEAAKFAHIMNNGGGLNNLTLHDTIKNIHLIYLNIAAHLDAARDVNSDVTLEVGLQALRLVRSMALEENNEAAE